MGHFAFDPSPSAEIGSIIVKPCQYPGFHQALHTTVLVLKSSRAQAAVDPLPKHLVEVTFAAHYFLNVYDLIPDNRPEIGLADDYAVLKRVMARNRMELDDIVHSPFPGT
jgi:hypothetical protein